MSSNHPFINMAVKGMETIAVLLGLNPGVALSNMFTLLHSVEPDVRETDSWVDLDKEVLKTLEARETIFESDPMILESKQNLYDIKRRGLYRRYYSRLWAILWDAGYMSDKTFQFYDPSGGRKSGWRKRIPQ